MTLAIKLKSLKDSAENSDGLRILIARYRPRYLPKDKENWDQWWKEIAPSRDLWKSYIKDKKIGWLEYERQYIDEIKNNPESVNLLQIVSSFVNGNGDGSKYVQQEQEQQKRYDLIQKCDTLTLLCHCKDEKYCHRSIVKEMILKSSWNI
jgi:uncharacterized protein YeaO (DUF488 family)